MSIGLSRKLQLGRQGTQWIFVPSFARERNPYPLAHPRRRRTRSSIALIHIMAHVVPSRPLKGMRYGDTTEWRAST